MNIGEAEEDQVETLNPSNFESSSFEDPMDSLTVVDDAFTEAEQKLVKFVSEKIEYMNDNLLSSEYDQIEKVNAAMINYSPVLFALNSLYSRIKYRVQQAESEKKAFEAEAYMMAKDALMKQANDMGIKSTERKNFLARQEVEAFARVKYKSAFAKLEAKLAYAESRRSFIERMCRGWDAYQFILTTLSKNLQADARANGIDYYAANHTPMTDDDRAAF